MTELKTLRGEGGSKETHTIMMLGVLFVSASTVQLGEIFMISTVSSGPNVSVVISIYVMHTYRWFLFDLTAPLNLHISQPLASNK
jgi:hypothetical protein